MTKPKHSKGEKRGMSPRERHEYPFVSDEGHAFLVRSQPAIRRYALHVHKHTKLPLDRFILIVFNPAVRFLKRLADEGRADGDPPISVLPWPDARDGLLSFLGVDPEAVPEPRPGCVMALVMAAEDQQIVWEEPVITVEAPSPLEPWPREDDRSTETSLDHVQQVLFDTVPTLMTVFGTTESRLFDHLVEGVEPVSTLADAGLSIEQQVEAAAGLYPILVVSTDGVLDRDRTPREVHAWLAEVGEVAYEYRPAFLALPTLDEVSKRLAMLILDRKCFRNEKGGRRALYVEAKKGERLCWVIFAASPTEAPVAH